MAIIAYFLLIFVLPRLRLSGGLYSPGPHWVQLYLLIPIFILPSTIFVSLGFGQVSFYNLDKFPEAVLIQGSLWVIYSVVIYLLSLFLFDRLFGSYKFKQGCAEKPLITILVISCLIVFCLILVYFYSGTLPIINLTNDSVRVLRKVASENTPGYIKNILIVLGVLGACYSGSIYTLKGYRLSSVFLLIICCIGLGWDGSKSSFAFGILFFYFSFLYFSNKEINIIRLLKILVVCIFIVFSFYFFSYTDKDVFEILKQIIGRIFLGQMAGFYEAFYLASPDPVYVLNWIPFGSLFGINVEPFAKKLMTDLYGESDTLSFLNSFFIQEAWASFGVLGLLLSPVVVAFSCVASSHMMVGIVKNIASYRFTLSAVFIVFYRPSIVGELGNFVFFKGFIFNVSVIVFVALSIMLVNQLVRK